MKKKYLNTRTVAFLLCLLAVSLAAKAQWRSEVSLGLLQSVDAYQSRFVTSEKQPWISVEEDTRKRFDYPGIRARIALTKPLTSHLQAAVQTGANMRISENLSGYRPTYFTAPLQIGIGYELLGSKSCKLVVNAFSGINVFHIHNFLSRLQTGSLHNAELACRLGGNGRGRAFVIKAGYELEIDHKTFFYHADQSFLHDENFSWKVERHQIYLAVGMVF